MSEKSRPCILTKIPADSVAVGRENNYTGVYILPLNPLLTGGG